MIILSGQVTKEMVWGEEGVVEVIFPPFGKENATHLELTALAAEKLAKFLELAAVNARKEKS